MPHYAILVGVSAYPLSKATKLDGPPNDVALVRDWLLSADGGRLDGENIRIMQSPDPDQETNDDYPPTSNHIWAALRKLVYDDQNVLQHRTESRLYLYFSGHGFSAYKNEGELTASIFPGNAAPYAAFGVCGTAMAQWCHNAGAFGEIVLVMDCCRDQELSKFSGEPQLNPMMDRENSKHVRRFEIYAVPYGEKAQERAIDALGGKIYGLLTYAFIEALKNAPGKNGVRTGNDIKEFIEGLWGTLVGAQRVEQPYFVSRGQGNIEFPTTVEAVTPARIRFTPALAGAADLLISDSTGVPVRRIALVPGQQVVFDLVQGGNGVPVPFDGQHVDVQLPGAIYKLALTRTGLPEVTRLWNLLGDADVDLAI